MSLKHAQPSENPERDVKENFTPRRLYGRSKGRPLSRRQAELLDQLSPRLACDLSSPLGALADLFATPVRDVWLEIGFGDGEHLAEAAARNGDIGFIGCEPFVNGVAKLLARVEARGLTNIRVHRGDAAEVIDWLPSASVGRVFLLYPDPWLKRRHHKRRFISPENLARLARIMKKGAQLRLATDIDAYGGWALAHLRACADFAWTAQSAADWLAPWDGWTRTKYESKALAAGVEPVYLTFVRI
ncbi:MAG: tRNA (guanosine(46)-N7)-methyltransferase TrmB [Methylocystis sp.]|nr:tRNA (guanosine(46)-N7)-methyltransferase TrmB [Methylocystis sp.]MBI3276041.1 tRNA (guanosine(46)-N7)-methyltransferase TrmB [Methylocystis sp.]